MKSMREKYFEHFEKIQTPADNRRGFKTEYRYKGKYYAWDLPDAALKKRRILYPSLEAVSAVVFFAAALRVTAFNAIAPAAGLCLLSIAPWIAEIWGVLRFSFSGMPMIEPDYAEIRDFIKVGAVIRVILLLLGSAAGTIFLIRNGQMSAENALVIAGHLVSGAVSFFIFRMQSRLSCRVFGNDNGKPGEEL